MKRLEEWRQNAILDSCHGSREYSVIGKVEKNIISYHRHNDAYISNADSFWVGGWTFSREIIANVITKAPETWPLGLGTCAASVYQEL